MSEVEFSNTTIGMHVQAKELKMKAYSLGCSCYDCCKEFDEMLQENKMKDDSLSDTQKNGGYCPKCDTVYDRPHKCVGIPYPYNEPEKSEGAFIAEAEMAKAVAEYPNNVYAKQIWNAAIEAAALEMDKLEFQISAAKIRKLKK